MSAIEEMNISWQIKQGVLLLEGALVRNTLLKLYAEKKQLIDIEEIDLTGLIKVDSAGLAVIAQIALQPYPKKILVKGASPELISLIEAYKLPLAMSS